MTELEPLYLIKVTCMCCEQSFQTSRVRTSFKKTAKTDSDFCIHYKTVNPDFYVVRVCPFCGFSFTENFSDRLTPKHKHLYLDKLGKNWNGLDLTGERDWNEAMQSYKLALLCAQIKEEKDRVIAGLLHHIAWLYRYKDNKEQEKRFLEFALESYVKVFETEGEDVNNARLMYLIGELHRRLGNYQKAVLWFGRVINDKKIMDSAMIRACREQWVQTREDMLAAKLDLPDEMKEGGS
ncbi:DUF2225 domain-containing protein [Paenibacillus mesophilus]|uniref:DUF2225 domain-containing protein n=1 Tax=Paenibacillus mesophilus TaxID=2582849 RepID=UPI0023686A50|nr:DUF2225 domain-containing protein [Paenibacillus mesophilus]